MSFGSHPVPPPFDPQDPKALRTSAEQDHKNNVGLTQDIDHILGWVTAAIRWPFRRVLGLVRRS